jgi:hypothetical protein
VYVSSLSSTGEISHNLKEGRGAWIHVIKGSCSINGNTVTGGDAVAIEETGLITIKGAGEPSEIIVFDLT